MACKKVGGAISEYKSRCQFRCASAIVVDYANVPWYNPPPSLNMQTTAALYRYCAIHYVPDSRKHEGIIFAIIAFLDLRPSIIALKRIPSWVPILVFDPEADLDILNGFLDELPGAIRLDPQYLNRATEWETSIRVSPPQEFITSNFEGTFSVLADAEFGAETPLCRLAKP